MSISVRVKELMRKKGISAYNLSNYTGISQATLSRILNKDTKPNASNLKSLAEYFQVEQEWLLSGNEDVENYSTGYYYPDVSASAGLGIKLDSYELNKIPISIPNWGKDLMFINVYGDSMYPKYCSGEIIGIKEIQADMLHFGLAYVVIMNDDEVYLKYITGGKNDEFFTLSSENPKHPPREYHLSLIKKIFIIKGVITKTTM